MLCSFPRGAATLVGGLEMDRCTICLLMIEFCGSLNDEQQCSGCSTELADSEPDDQDVIELTIIRDMKESEYGKRA